MVTVVALTFLMSWSPFYLVSFISQVQTESFLLRSNFLFTMLSTHLVGFTNSSINPFVYTMLSDKFRSSFKRIVVDILTACCCCCAGRAKRFRRGLLQEVPSRTGGGSGGGGIHRGRVGSTTRRSDDWDGVAGSGSGFDRGLVGNGGPLVTVTKSASRTSYSGSGGGGGGGGDGYSGRVRFSDHSLYSGSADVDDGGSEMATTHFEMTGRWRKSLHTPEIDLDPDDDDGGAGCAIIAPINTNGNRFRDGCSSSGRTSTCTVTTNTTACSGGSVESSVG